MDREIIIDGVNVSGCEYACNTAFGKNGCKHPMMKNIYCFKNPNCDYKQLQRKTVECNKYKQALDEIEKITSGNYETLDPLAKQQIRNIISKVREKEQC